MTQDFTTLNNPRFLYLAELSHPFPDWVANQAVPNEGDFKKCAAVAFADPVNRLLPIATKEAAFYSAINVFANLDAFGDEVFERVKSACAYFEIENDIAPYVTLFADEHEKSAHVPEPEGRFAIDTELNGQTFRLFPLNDAEDVRSSAMDLSKMASEDRIHIMQFVPAAREIVKAAHDHGVPSLPSMITRVGSERVADLAKVASGVHQRAGLRAGQIDSETCAAAQKNYDDIAKQAAEGALSAEECWEGIAAIDDQIGLRPKFHKSAHILLATDIVYNGPLESEVEKAASEHVLINEVLVPLSEIHRINALDASFKLTKSAAESFGKIRDSQDARDISLAVETWDDTDRRTLLRMAASLPESATA